MKFHSTFFKTGLFILVNSLMGCGTTPRETTGAVGDFLLLVEDSTLGGYGYRNLAGEMVIPVGKYAYCFTDTFTNYALVAKDGSGFVVIDRQEQVLYQVFQYDNGPDYPSDGLFRIVQNGKIGFADAATYQVVIQPQFTCAFPFENGVARVSNDCTTKTMGEHSEWLSENWVLIDRTGKEVGLGGGN